jgi:hypothetical protein
VASQGFHRSELVYDWHALRDITYPSDFIVVKSDNSNVDLRQPVQWAEC